MDLDQMQKRVYQNKLNKGFNVTDVPKEFCYLYGEVAEAYDAYLKNKEDLGEELADIAIYLLGLSEILGYNLKEQIEYKMQKNEKRVYKKVGKSYIKVENGVCLFLEILKNL